MKKERVQINIVVVGNLRLANILSTRLSSNTHVDSCYRTGISPDSCEALDMGGLPFSFMFRSSATSEILATFCQSMLVTVAV